MKKHELIKFLEPFDDEIDVVVRGHKLIGGATTELQYLPYTDERPAIVAIQLHGIGAVDTGVSG